MKGGPYTVTVTEDMTGVPDMWTSSLITGAFPAIREMGEIDGIEWIAPTYQTLCQNAS
ncbi:MAG TPA: hypothetical protein VIJ63_10415 [Roseiarcus sp.]